MHSSPITAALIAFLFFFARLRAAVAADGTVMRAPLLQHVLGPVSGATNSRWPHVYPVPVLQVHCARGPSPHPEGRPCQIVGHPENGCESDLATMTAWTPPGPSRWYRGSDARAKPGVLNDNLLPALVHLGESLGRQLRLTKPPR